jgi:hypothetical protein
MDPSQHLFVTSESLPSQEYVPDHLQIGYVLLSIQLPSGFQIHSEKNKSNDYKKQFKLKAMSLQL